jgi:hypothetical protein
MRGSIPSLGDRRLQRPLAGEPIHQAHDAEALRARQRGQHAAFRDAEHRPRVALSGSPA